KVRNKGVFPSGQGGNYSVQHVQISGGQNTRINIASHDHSTNIATQWDVFGDISAALQGVVKNDDELRDLLSAVDEMKRQRGGAGFVAAYRRFVSLAADHLVRGVVTVTGWAQRVDEVELCFMQRQPHLATGQSLRL